MVGREIFIFKLEILQEPIQLLYIETKVTLTLMFPKLHASYDKMCA
jgi:hypothetical protein